MEDRLLRLHFYIFTNALETFYDRKIKAIKVIKVEEGSP